jgi:3-hydroxymyristoyl/3-hydroxydecanoyl-(acyl carrier protein) dehydratase
MAATIALQTQLLSRLRHRDSSAPHDISSGEIPRSLAFEQCQEFAAGSIAKALGPTFAEADSFPTRVRLPDGPLMLVDRILEIHGEPRSMTSGRVVTEHLVHAERWYLDAGRMPTCVAVEAGQADLFLSGFLGIDFVTRGLAVYRLLDAAITFHGPLPKFGDLVRYDIRIDGFFRQGDTHLFRFRFESTVDGRPVLTMTDGCAGFFTAEELASGKGIVQTELDRRVQPGKRPADWQPLVPMQRETYSSSQIDALRAGNLVSAFGESFAGLPLRWPLRLPGGMLRLVDRVVQLDPEGGRFGLGLIRAEADIHPDDWFLTCHFVDDMVMPGTLMYECCLHTLRIFLMRLGWIGEEGEVVCEPLPGVSSRLKCRGQVIASTKTAAYEVVIKEIGYGPEPYAIADALMYADGRPIVEMSNMSLRFSGLDREKVEKIWLSRGKKPSRFDDLAAEGQRSIPLTPTLSPEAGERGQASYPLTSASGQRERASYPLSPGFAGERVGVRGERLTDTSGFNPVSIFDRERILAFAIGKPSEAFGEPYRVFDDERIIARLPGPPYQFLDRITRIEAEPWRMVAGGVIEAEYDVPAEDWYFAAHRSPRMPFAVLLEVALQPCGWLAAYVGSALTSPIDLSFRNLGGSAVQHLPVGSDIGTLTTTVKLTRVSSSAGMIIQHYDFAVRSRGRNVYTGDTYFGFFTKQALANQVGLRECALYQPDAGELARAWQGEYPREAPFPDSMLRMVDRITWYVPDGGPRGLGSIEGRIAVDPQAWFFQAHFYQDPVWPGSLGLESFVQLLQFAAADRWKVSPIELISPAAGAVHRWTYRGQVLPVDREVTVQAYIKNVDNDRRLLTADGLLSVDGRVIYQMTDFTVATRN